MIEFLSPVSKKVIAHREVLHLGVLGKEIKVYHTKGDLPDLTNVKFAILGIQENRNDVNYMGAEVCFDAIRKSFYELYSVNWSYKIVDLFYSNIIFLKK